MEPTPQEVARPKTPTPADASVSLQLYDLRREAELRQARHWWLAEFWPEMAADFLRVAQAIGTPENNWLRQVPSYWELAASLVLHRTVSEALFLEPAFSGEMFFIFAKVHPFLKDLREKMQNPHILANVEKAITKSKAGRERLRVIAQRLAARREQMQAGGVRTEPSTDTVRASPGRARSGSARRVRGRTEG